MTNPTDNHDDHGHGHGHGGGGPGPGMFWALGILLIVLVMSGTLQQFVAIIILFLGNILQMIRQNMGPLLGIGAIYILYKHSKK